MVKFDNLKWPSSTHFVKIDFLFFYLKQSRQHAYSIIKNNILSLETISDSFNNTEKSVQGCTYTRNLWFCLLRQQMNMYRFTKVSNITLKYKVFCSISLMVSKAKLVYYKNDHYIPMMRFPIYQRLKNDRQPQKVSRGNSLWIFLRPVQDRVPSM